MESDVCRFVLKVSTMLPKRKAVNGNNYLHYLQQKLPALLKKSIWTQDNVCSFNTIVHLRTGVEELDTIWISHSQIDG